jgi:hypothetical protein
VTDQRQSAILASHRRAQFPPVGLGLSSVLLGAIGLVLFLVPILGISISVAGIIVGVSGIVGVNLGWHEVSLRLCVAGVLLSICGLMMNAAIARAPSGYFSPRSVFPTLQPESQRPYVPPPAAPRM